MSSKYHIGKNGPSVCGARVKPCPLGGEIGTENHYLTKEEAQAAYEAQLEQEYGDKTITKQEEKPSNNSYNTPSVETNDNITFTHEPLDFANIVDSNGNIFYIEYVSEGVYSFTEKRDFKYFNSAGKAVPLSHMVVVYTDGSEAFFDRHDSSKTIKQLLVRKDERVLSLKEPVSVYNFKENFTNFYSKKSVELEQNIAQVDYEIDCFKESLSTNDPWSDNYSDNERLYKTHITSLENALDTLKSQKEFLDKVNNNPDSVFQPEVATRLNRIAESMESSYRAKHNFDVDYQMSPEEIDYENELYDFTSILKAPVKHQA